MAGASRAGGRPLAQLQPAAGAPPIAHKDNASPAEARRILAWMCVLVAVNQFGFGAAIPVLPLYAQSFGVSYAAIGLTVAVYGLSRVLLSVPTGQLADRLGRRSALAVGGALAAAGNIWCALAGGYAELVVARLVAGAGAGVLLTAGIIVLADITHIANRGRVMAIYQGVFLFASGLGPLPGGLLAEWFGLAAPFVASGVAGGMAALVGWFAVAETRAFGANSAAARAAPLPLREQFRAVAHGGFLLAGLVGLVAAIARTGALFSVAPVLARERLALAADEIGLGLALGSLAGLAVTYPAGTVADRHGRKPVIVTATVVTAASMLGFGLAATYGWFLAACIVWGAAAAAAGAAPAAYAADSAPPGMNAAAMSGYRMLSDMGYVLGPIALGALGDWGGLDAPFWVAAALLLLAAILFGRYAPSLTSQSSTRPR